MKGEPSTILIVDDEEMSRIVMAAQLEDDGFRVAAAKDAAEALGLLEKRQGRFAVAVLDCPRRVRRQAARGKAGIGQGESATPLDLVPRAC